MSKIMVNSIFDFIDRNISAIIFALVIYHFVVSGLFINTFRILPYEFHWFTDVLILFLFIYSVANKISNRNKTKTFIFPKVFYLILILFAWSSITALANSIKFITYLLHLKDNLRYIILALAIINLHLSFKDTEKIMWFMWLILIVLLSQVPATAIQFGYWGMGDQIVGTLTKGGTSEMVLLCCFGVSFVISLYLYSKENLLLVVSVPFFSLPVIFGNIHAGLILYPYTIIFTLLGKSKKNIKAALMIFGFVVVFIITFFYMAPPFKSAAKRYVSLFDVAVQDQFMRKTRSSLPGRFVAPIVATEWLSKSDFGWLFGYGFGITKRAYWPQTAGIYAHQPIPKTNQIATSLVETGLPGLLLSFLLLIWLFVWGNNLIRKTRDFAKSMSVTFTCMVSLMIIGSLYSNVLKSYYFGFLFWFVYSLLYAFNLDYLSKKAKQNSV